MTYTKIICKETIRELIYNKSTIEYFEYDLNRIPKDANVLILPENNYSQVLGSYGDIFIMLQFAVIVFNDCRILVSWERIY